MGATQHKLWGSTRRVTNHEIICCPGYPTLQRLLHTTVTVVVTSPGLDPQACRRRPWPSLPVTVSLSPSLGPSLDIREILISSFQLPCPPTHTHTHTPPPHTQPVTSNAVICLQPMTFLNLAPRQFILQHLRQIFSQKDPHHFLSFYGSYRLNLEAY